MKLHHRSKQCIVFLLSFLLAFEPFAVNMVYANSGEMPVPDQEVLDPGDDGIVDINEVEMPVEYLEYVWALRGRSRGDDEITANKIDEATAWGEWMNTVTGAYALMDDGCSDVFSFYNTLGEISNEISPTVSQLDQVSSYYTCLCYATNKAALAGSFIAKKIPGLSSLGKIADRAGKWCKNKANMIKGFDKMGKTFKTATRNVDTFLSHMCPPIGFRKGCESGEGFVSYWRWIARKTNLDRNPNYKNYIAKVNSHLSPENQICTNAGSKVMSNTKAVAHSIGIGLTIVGIALDSYGIYSSKDAEAGRYNTYALVKNYVGLFFGVGSLVAMFCVPVVGQVLFGLSLIWTALSTIGDILGDFNKKWKEAYKGSFEYLYMNDSEFRIFYDNREYLTTSEKSASLLITERNYADYRDGALAFQAANANDLNFYNDESQEAVSARVYLELEKQGILTSYYNKSAFKLPDYSLATLMDRWKVKADYMAWKPSHKETLEAENRSTLGKIGHYLNPMTYVTWAGDKINTAEYKDKIEKNNYEKVFCNPDYCLIKKYQTWLTTNKKMGPGCDNSFYKALGLRIEQSPFNYIPLVGIDMAAWSDDLLIQSFNADSFIIGIKELNYFSQVVENAKKAVEEGTKQATKQIESLKDSVKFFTESAEALQVLRDGYRNSPDSESKGKEILKNKHVKKAFGWKWRDGDGKCTPRNIMKTKWIEINRSLTYDSLSVSTKGAECVLLLDTIKRNLDTAVIMNELLKEKQEALNNFDEEFTNPEVAQFLRDGSFLDVKGGTFMDWLSGELSAYEQLKDNIKLFSKKVKAYAEAADESNTGHEEWVWGLFTTDNEEYHPNHVIGEINEVLRFYRNVTGDYEDIVNELNLDGLPLTAPDVTDRVFIEYPTRDLEGLNPNDDVVAAAVIPEGE